MANQLNGWWYAADAYLTLEHKKDNAKKVYEYFRARGWSNKGVCAMLGNMDVESSINPGLIEGRRPTLYPDAGYGLTQWTPYTKLSEWAEEMGLEWRNNGDTQCLRIERERLNEYQWVQNVNISFYDFSVATTESLSYLTNAFCRNYERPADPDIPERIRRARFWYNYLVFPMWLYFKVKRRNNVNADI